MVYLIYAGLWPVQMASAGGISLPLCFGGCQRELPWHEPTFRRHQECVSFQFWLSHCKYDQITCCMMSLCMIVIASSRVSRSVDVAIFVRNKFGQFFPWWLRNKRGLLFSGAFCCTVACFNLKKSSALLLLTVPGPWCSNRGFGCLNGSSQGIWSTWEYSFFQISA